MEEEGLAKLSLTIFDALGKQIYVTILESLETHHFLDLNKHPAVIYQLVLSNAQKVLNMKLLKVD